jgi:hypothetical protein
MTTRSSRTFTFGLLEKAADRGERCPISSGPDAVKGTKPGDVAALEREGFISIHPRSGHNWRMVTILKGPHAGKSTAPYPTNRDRPLADRNMHARRAKPSAPRFLTLEEMSR